MLFIASSFSYGDRVAFSIAGTAMQTRARARSGEARLSALRLQLGLRRGQLPSGGLLDRFGSKRVYGISIISWTICAFLTGFAGYVFPAMAFSTIFVAAAALGPGAVASLSWQRPHRCRVVSDGGARHCFSGLQLLAVLRAGDVRPAVRLAGAHAMAGEAASGSWESSALCSRSYGGRPSTT